ncbi:MAG TPA: HAD family phosphatase [Candidatus Paceibacterota bacterium]|nr:HAD family phosphatase [Candidatus Paceibacterota bacterium]
MIEAVIFDFFGVICPDLHKTWTEKHHIKDPGALYREIGEKVDLGLAPEKAYIETLSKRSGIPNGEIEKELDEMRMINTKVIDIIKTLKERYKIGLLSDASATLLRRILGENGLIKYFDAIVISSEVGHTKPSAEIFRAVLTTLDVEPQKAIFIDDGASNIRGAEAVGIKGILFEGADELTAKLKDLNLLKIMDQPLG